MSGPRLFTIQAGLPFLDALAQGLLDLLREAGEPLGEALILLPNRRAVRALTEAFLKAAGTHALILPRIAALGDLDEDELVIAEGLDLPPAIAPLERLMLLSRLVAARRPGGTAMEPTQALKLARALADLLDEAATEEVDLHRLADLVPADLAQHWQDSLQFLEILTKAWPAVLAERGQIDFADRRIRLIREQARRWEQAPPRGWVIAAGSTGSIPATADLLSLVARLERGAVVLPALDLALDDAAFEGLDAGHPQAGLALLLRRMRATRDDVRPWPGTAGPPGPRAHLLSVALRPAEATANWAGLRPGLPLEAAFRDMSLLEAASPRDEAAAIALLLREGLERPGTRSALVTPDRSLARRVAAELGRFGLKVDDSAGQPLARTQGGVFLRLVAEMAMHDLAPVPLLACLKHPLAALGLARGIHLADLRRLERRVLRGVRPAPGAAGLRKALAAAEAQEPEPQPMPELHALLDRLGRACGTLLELVARPDASLEELIDALVTAAEAIAATDDEPGAERIWRGAEGEALAGFLDEVRRAAGAQPPMPGRSLAPLLTELMAGSVVRPAYGTDPRIAIWSPIEARLQGADRLILAGLNEGTWPALPEVDPWLSPRMRQDLGLPPAERRIGQSAHDFVVAASGGEVVLSRATKVDGTPTVQARWLARLQALAGRPLPACPAGAWVPALDPPAGAPPPPPQPRPPVAVRPRTLYVTQVEQWVRNPYAVYARQILKLRRLDDLDADPGAADRGNAIHDALDAFLRSWGDRPLDDGVALDHLVELGRQAFGPTLDRPAARAFWWPRFQVIARWFLEQERTRRAAGWRPLASEVTGALELPGPAGSFKVMAKADRIDAGPQGLAIIDYKTGGIPKQDWIDLGFAPQLPLEAAIALGGGFPGVDGARGVAALEFWQLKGAEGKDRVALVKGDPAGHAADALTRLREMVTAFDDPATPYLARPRPAYATPNDYEHLARIAEWAPLLDALP